MLNVDISVRIFSLVPLFFFPAVLNILYYPRIDMGFKMSLLGLIHTLPWVLEIKRKWLIAPGWAADFVGKS